MVRIKSQLPVLVNGERALASGHPIAPYPSLLLLFAPVLCCDNQCRVPWLCIGLNVVAAAGLYVLLAISRELRLLGERLTF